MAETKSTSKYIVRQPIKDLQGTVLGYEIRYTGENTGYNGEEGQDFSAAETPIPRKAGR